MDTVEWGSGEGSQGRHNGHTVGAVLGRDVGSGRREDWGGVSDMEVRWLSTAAAASHASHWGTARSDTRQKRLTHHGSSLGSCTTNLLNLVVRVNPVRERERERERVSE